GSAANANRVVSLRLQIEQRVERDYAIDARQWNLRLLRNVLQGFARKVFVGVMFLGRLQNAEQSSWMAQPAKNDLIDESPLWRVEPFVRRCLHGTPFA